jgi:hypothetical protein
VTVYVTLTDDMGNTITGQDISFYVDGMFIANVTSIEGEANVTYLVTQDPVSVLPVTGEYAGIGEYSIVLKNGALLIPKTPTNINIDIAKNFKVGQNTVLKSRLTDKDGNPIANATVDFYVNGKKVGSAITDSNGIAKLNYTVKKSGNYNITAKYSGDSTYLSSNATNKTTVFKIKTITTIDKDGDKIIVTVTDEDGNPIEGKKVVIKDPTGRVLGVGITNKDGKFTFTIEDKSITLTATFDGDDTYLGSHASITIKSKATDNSKDNSVNAKMQNTGIPIVAILLVLLAMFGAIYRKK